MIGLGTDDPRVIIGIGVNADWRRADFPPALAASMTSLREIAGGRPIDPAQLLEAFLERLEARAIALRAGRFDADGWLARQITSDRTVRLEGPDGGSSDVRALGVDPNSGGLIVEDPASAVGRRIVLTGEIVHLRLVDGKTGDRLPVGPPVVASARV
jgi:biotin-(acetyl-CoA carboxylase) ligase